MLRLIYRPLLAFVFAAVMVALHWLPVGRMLEREYGLPLLYALRGDLPAPAEAIVIGLDNQSVHALNAHYQADGQRWPLLDDCLPFEAQTGLTSAVNINHIPRALHACLLDVLTARKARVVSFDINFNQTRPGDDLLAAAVARAGNVLLFQRASGSGADFIYHRHPKGSIKAGALDTMAFQIDSARGEIATSYITTFAGFADLRAMPDRAWAAYTGLALAPAAVRVQPIWMYGPPQTIHTVRIGDVFNPASTRGLPDDMSEIAVFVGSSDPEDAGIDDHFPIPTSGRGNNLVGGVELAATAFLNRLHGTMLHRPPPLAQTLVVFAMAFLGGLAVLGLAGLRLWFAIGSVALGYLLVAAIAFSEALVWLPLAVPVFLTSVLLCLGALSVRYVFARTLVGRLVPKPVASALMEGTRADRRAAWSEDATIMFTDLVGSTSMAEHMSQLDFTEATNVYYDAVTDLVEDHDGMVVEFQGDGIVAMFTESVSGKAHAEKACRAARALAQQLDDLNTQNPEAEPLRIRIGLNSGITATGDIGARQRFTFKALGEVVILAARLEQHGKAVKTGNENIVLLSGSTRDGAPGLQDEFELIGPVALRGRSEPIDVYRLRL